MNINNEFLSPNYSHRKQKIDYIIIHYTEMNFDDALRKLIDKKSEVSAHYLIKEDGEIFQLVDDQNVAWHAGLSFWNGQNALNQNSIGIELDNLGNNEFSKAQMRSCIKLSQALKKKYDIPKHNFIGHSDVAPTRKIDPGIFFNWKLCAENGLGIWHDLEPIQESLHLNPLSNTEKSINFGDKGRRVAKLQKNLSKLGYQLEVTSIFDIETNYVIRSFQAKFYPQIIKQKGIDFYNDNNSLYSWCIFSERILQRLL